MLKHIIIATFEAQPAGWGVGECWKTLEMGLDKRSAVWKPIYSAWEQKSTNDRILKFWWDAQCEDEALKEKFIKMYLISAKQFSTVAELHEYHLGIHFWNLGLKRGIGDWEMLEVWPIYWIAKK